MNNLISCFGRGTAKNARALQTLRTAHAIANNGTGGNKYNDPTFDATATHRVNNDRDDNDVPSLRTKLENDIKALEWDSFASKNATHNGSTHHHASSSSSTTSSLRSGTAALAARITNSVDCTLDPETPRYLASAMEDASSPQCRLIVNAHPPFRVVHASPAWESLTGIRREHTEGRPAFSVLLSAQSTRMEGIDSLMESLHLHCRGCATVTCRASSESASPFLAKLTVSPLIDAYGDISHMLCVVRRL